MKVSVTPAITGTMSPSGEIWPMKPRSVSPKWMLSSRPRVGESPFAMYCLRISTGVAPFTSIEPRLRMSGERMSPPLERVGAAHRVGLLAERAKEPADDLRLPIEVHEPLLERAREPHPVVELEPLRARERGAGSAGDDGARIGLSCARRRPAPRRCRPRGRHQYAASSVCDGSSARCNWTKNFFTLRSRRLSPIWSVTTSTNV